MPARREEPIGIERCACITALGDTAETYRRLMAGEVGLKRIPFLGQQGGEEVPIALIGDRFDETAPPRWLEPLDQLVSQIPDAPWGSLRYPVFLTSSNFDVGSLYTYRQTHDERYLRMGTPGRTLEALAKRYGWGSNRLALSHACVTAQVAIEMATQRLREGLADKALILSFDFVSPFVAGGFHALKILNDQLPAPFMDRPVGSIGLGDGAAFAVLSRADAPCRIESNFLYNEMYHFTSNEPSGSGFAAVADWMIEAAGGRALWIKGHGTGTLDSGRLEAESFAKALPASPLVSWKGSLGHTLGSCAAIELAIVVESIIQGEIPGCLDIDATPFAANVRTRPVPSGDYEAVAMVCNAFGGAHAGCLISYGG